MTSETTLILRTCNHDLTSRGGFTWPDSGPVAAPDWDPIPECGHGLHGWAWGEGDGSLGNWEPEARWLVVEVPTSTIVDLGGKVKFPAGTVIHCGDRLTATTYLAEHDGHGRAIIGATVTGGYEATVTGGDWATVTGGDGATVTGGDWATVTGGYEATVTGGYGATVTGGDWATVTGGYEATVTGGDGATVTGGDWATVTGGYEATVTGGYGATVTGGNRATVTGGYEATVTGGYGATVTGGNRATVTGGDRATLVVRWWDRAAGRYRLTVGYVGEDGIEPNTAYRCGEAGRLVAVESAVVGS